MKYKTFTVHSAGEMISLIREAKDILMHFRHGNCYIKIIKTSFREEMQHLAKNAGTNEFEIGIFVKFDKNGDMWID